MRRQLIAVLLVLSVAASSCGTDANAMTVAVTDRAASSADPRIAGEAISRFGFDLFGDMRRQRSEPNLTVSPASVAIALALLELGAVGESREQLRELLHIDDGAQFHASANALEVDLENRELDDVGEGDPGEMRVRIANAAYLQDGVSFEPAYLDAIGTNYGPVLNQVDFATDPDAVADTINDFVADATEDQITELLADGVLRPETVLALVNALYLKASWVDPFEKGATAEDSFTTLAGDSVDVEMMQGFGSSSSQGDGWVGATKQFSGRLSAQFILPDDGRFAEIAGDLEATFASYGEQQSSGAELRVPKFEVRVSVELDQSLQALGVLAPYEAGGLLGISADPRLAVDKTVHETFVAVDEEGIEAAAATVITVVATSGPASPPVPVSLDRPFFYRIVDGVSGAALFVGQVGDPTAG